MSEKEDMTIQSEAWSDGQLQYVLGAQSFSSFAVTTPWLDWMGF